MSEQVRQPPDQLREVFIGRQPILDRDQGLAGYELLFRATTENSAHLDGPRAAAMATADVVCKAFAELGLANVLGKARAFINVDALFLESDLVELLPKDIVVFEIDVAAFLDKSLPSRCRDLKARGYVFSISGVTEASEQLWALIELATWLKVNVDGLPGDRLQTSARALATTRRTLIAAHVESQTQMELCRLLGFHLFQGYYFAKPAIVEGRKLDASTQGLLHLIKLVADEADEARLDAVFRSEPALLINLLRLTNSVGAGAPARFGEVQVWETGTTNQLHAWKFGGDSLFGVSWSPDGTRLAFGGADKSVRIIGAEDGRERMKFDNHSDWVLRTAWVSDGSRLLSASRDRAMKLIQVTDGQFIDDVNKLLEPVVSMARHPKEEWAVYGGAEGGVRIYRSKENQERTAGNNDVNLVREFERQSGPVVDRDA